MDHKVDLLLEKVNANNRDGPASQSGDADPSSTTLQQSTRAIVPTWGNWVRDAAGGASNLAGTRRFQIAAAAVCMAVLCILTVVLVLVLSWSAPPTFLTALAVPKTVPAGSSGPGSVMIDVQLALDRTSQVPFWLKRMCCL